MEDISKLSNIKNKNYSLNEILEPYLKKIENKSFTLYEKITVYLIQLTLKIINKEFKRFPQFEKKIIEIFKNIFEKEKEKTKILIVQILKS